MKNQGKYFHKETGKEIKELEKKFNKSKHVGK
jgi:hypothetical protein